MTGRIRRRACASLGFLLCILAWPRGSASADAPPSDAEALVQRGIELRKASRNAEALAEFQKAYALAPTSRTEAQMALALHALGDWLGAERGLEGALAAEADPWIAQYRAPLEGALATVRAHLARLFVSVNVSAGELRINGVGVRTVPFPDSVRVVAGTLDVAVIAPGYVQVQRTIHVAPGSEDRESFWLEPEPAPAVVSHPPIDAVADRPATPTAVPPHDRSYATLGYVSLGAAGLLAVGGGVAWRLRENDVSIYNDDSRCLVGTQTRNEQCGSYARAADGALAVEVIAFSAAAVATGLGAFLLLTGRPQGRVAWCSPSGGLGIACGGSF
jgi:hypothetical protein